MRRPILAALLLVVVLLAACDGPKFTQPPEYPPQAVGQPTQTAGQPTPARPTVEPTKPPEEYAFAEASDLSRLASYRAHYIYKWEGTQNGKSIAGTWDILEEVVKAPPARHIVWNSTDIVGAGGEGKVEFIQVGKDTYMSIGASWLAMNTGERDPFEGKLLLTPLRMVSENRGKLVQRGVVVNGVSTDQYVFDETTLGAAQRLGTIAKAQGDVWVSPELKTVVKYTAHYEGTNLAIDGRYDGTLDIAMDLTDINQPIRITAPEGVQPAMPEDIPVMEDAVDLTAIAGIVAYKTARSIEDITAFYEAQMPTQGWTKAQSEIPGVLSFTKGARQATVMIQTEDGKTTVTVMTRE